ncbi:MAG TPA: DUF5666 domain-containing protein, partial [Thermoanaerobaculia bacterium]|nr:DUF5666 domain-containing protein [Thermoanaerobaculia bacterium]
MTRRILRITLLCVMLIALTSSLGAGTHRAVVSPGLGDSQTDALGIGLISGSSVTGTVASVQGMTITLNSGAAPAIHIDASSAKFLADKGTATIADVKPGVRLTAFIDDIATANVGAALRAKLITIEALPDLSVTGSVQSIDIAGSKLTVLGITIAVDANTAFGAAFPTFAAIKGLGDLAVGQVVNV